MAGDGEVTDDPSATIHLLLFSFRHPGSPRHAPRGRRTRGAVWRPLAARRAGHRRGKVDPPPLNCSMFGFWNEADRGRENGSRRPAGRSRLTHSKTAATRTAIAIIASLFRAGCMSGGHGVKRMDGARARRHRRGGAQVHSRKRQARDRGHGSWNHGGAVSR